MVGRCCGISFVVLGFRPLLRAVADGVGVGGEAGTGAGASLREGA